MTKRALWLSAPLLASLVWMTGCGPVADQNKADASAESDAGSGADATTDGGASSMTCYVAAQFTCNDYPAPTAAQLTDVPAACSSASGVLSTACPTAAFKGKCTRPEGPTVPGPYVERFYDGADVGYAQDFCVNTANGVWSTTF